MRYCQVCFWTVKVTSTFTLKTTPGCILRNATSRNQSSRTCRRAAGTSKSRTVASVPFHLIERCISSFSFWFFFNFFLSGLVLLSLSLSVHLQRCMLTCTMVFCLVLLRTYVGVLIRYYNDSYVEATTQCFWHSLAKRQVMLKSLPENKFGQVCSNMLLERMCEVGVFRKDGVLQTGQ